MVRPSGHVMRLNCLSALGVTLALVAGTRIRREIRLHEVQGIVSETMFRPPRGSNRRQVAIGIKDIANLAAIGQNPFGDSSSGAVLQALNSPQGVGDTGQLPGGVVRKRIHARPSPRAGPNS